MPSKSKPPTSPLPPLPLELFLLILEYIQEKKELLNCSFVCRSWHEPCLRVAARTFAIRERHLITRRMPLPPHLRRYVRCIKLLVILLPPPSDDIDVFLSFIRDLPHPNEFFTAFIPLTVVLSTIRAQSTITHLDLYRCSGSLMDLFRMLEASAETLSSLKLAWFSPSDPHLSKDVKTISMLALRELTVSQCSLDSMRPDWIHFPNLKVLDFSDWSGHIVFRDCLPPSLNTLAVKARPEGECISLNKHPR